MKKVVLRLDLHDDRDKQKAMKAVSSLSGIDSVDMDMKEKKLSVKGDVDPVVIVSKLRKRWHAEIVSVGPSKEPEKKKKEPEKGDEKDQMAELIKSYKAYNPNRAPSPPHYYVQSAEEDPSTCVVC